jgi:hypothetical protein
MFCWVNNRKKAVRFRAFFLRIFCENEWGKSGKNTGFFAVFGNTEN